MAQKTQTVGRPPTPYPGSWNAFCDTLRDLISTYNHRPVGGLWGGRTPEEWRQTKVEAGWTATTVEPHVLDAAFADTDSRRVDRGVLKIKGQRYTHRLLSALPSRTVVDLALPWRRDALPLARLRDGWVYLEREIAYPARWVEGAHESTRRQRRQNQHVSTLSKDAMSIDPIAVKVRMAQRLTASPDPIQAVPLDLGKDTRERGRAAKSAGAPRPPPTPAELRRAEALALTEQLERANRG